MGREQRLPIFPFRRSVAGAGSSMPKLFNRALDEKPEVHGLRSPGSGESQRHPLPGRVHFDRAPSGNTRRADTSQNTRELAGLLNDSLGGNNDDNRRRDSLHGMRASFEGERQPGFWPGRILQVALQRMDRHARSWALRWCARCRFLSMPGARLAIIWPDQRPFARPERRHPQRIRITGRPN